MQVLFVDVSADPDRREVGQVKQPGLWSDPLVNDDVLGQDGAVERCGDAVVRHFLALAEWVHVGDLILPIPQNEERRATGPLGHEGLFHGLLGLDGFLLGGERACSLSALKVAWADSKSALAFSYSRWLMLPRWESVAERSNSARVWKTRA